MKRGRVSANELNVIPFAPARQRVQPPPDLTAKEARLFNELAATCSHFVPSDFPLLTSYVQATLLVQHHRHPKTADAAKILHTAIKMQILLATKLRLAPQSRIGPTSTARKAVAHRPSIYDTMDLNDAQHNTGDH